MLSILIPTYNYHCYPLVRQLNEQAGTIGISYEIIVADDASQEKYQIENRLINQLHNCKYIQQSINMGRARIRNFLASQAQGMWLLFMDCDAQLISCDFIQKYIDSISHIPVVCGGLLHPDTQPEKDVSLRYRYEKAADKHRSAATRNLQPYECFSTFCFLIKRELFSQIRFNESCHEYGYEDTLFGEELKNRGIKIMHIDNPLMHIGLENNATFLKKTETALQSLLRLQNNGIHFHSRLVDKYNSIKRLGLIPAFIYLFRLYAPLLKRNLLSENPSLTYFALYKLGYYACLIKEQNINK